MRNMRNKSLFEAGFPFTYELALNLWDMETVVYNNLPCCILVDGGLGSGKTTLAVHIADFIEHEEIDFNTQLALGGEEFKEKLQLCHELGKKVCIYDEAGDFSKRGAMTKFNRQLNRFFEMFRAYKILVIIVLPRFFKLESNIMDLEVTHMLVHTHDKCIDYSQFKVYDYERMLWLQHNIKKTVIPKQAYAKQTPNIRGYFKDLRPERSRELDRFSTKGKELAMSENILNAQGLITVGDIEKALSRSKAWVWKKLSDLMIKPAKRYRNKNYYDGEILGTLRQHLGGKNAND